MNQLENNLERITAILKTIEDTPPNLKANVVSDF